MLNNSRLPALCFFIMLGVSTWSWARLYPWLPDRMASHFSGSGVPNGWQPKQDFFVFAGIMVAVCAVLSFLLPRVAAVIPPALINLPNKSYWLASERREETWRVLASYMAWFGCALLFVLLYAISQAIRFNLPGHEPFNSRGMVAVLAGFCLFVVLLSVRMLRQFFSVPPSSG